MPFLCNRRNVLVDGRVKTPSNVMCCRSSVCIFFWNDEKRNWRKKERKEKTKLITTLFTQNSSHRIRNGPAKRPEKKTSTRIRHRYRHTEKGETRNIWLSIQWFWLVYSVSQLISTRCCCLYRIHPRLVVPSIHSFRFFFSLLRNGKIAKYLPMVCVCVSASAHTALHTKWIDWVEFARQFRFPRFTSLGHLARRTTHHFINNRNKCRKCANLPTKYW